METVAGVFRSRDDARRVAAELHRLRFDDDRINLLLPESSEEEIHSIPTSDTEQPGVGGAVGGVVGGAMGIGLGLAATALIPGVGPVLAIGGAAAALFGAGGAIGGAAVGTALDNKSTEGIPADEIFFYEDALRLGRSVVIALPENHDDAEWARKVFAQSGAETVDAAREAWWIGVRDAEREHYHALGENFDREEAEYRAGFMAALRRELRGKSFVAGMDYLKEDYPQIWESRAFRSGFDRGQIYLSARLGGAQPR